MLIAPNFDYKAAETLYTFPIDPNLNLRCKNVEDSKYILAIAYGSGYNPKTFCSIYNVKDRKGHEFEIEGAWHLYEEDQ